MMRMKSKLTGMSPPTVNVVAGGDPADVDWEMRPGGMLVQKRVDSDENATPPPTIRVRVKFGSVYHEISVNSQATFGELKRALTGPTGLHHEDQKLLFKDKERDSKAFLDVSGVKEKSKLVLVEDPIRQEKRLLEMRRNAKMDKAAKSISNISLELDRLATQVSALQSVISKGGKVAESEVLKLIELLMNEVIKLDAIVADGELKSQRKFQVKRVQRYVETLDMIKIKASTTPVRNGSRQSPVPSQSRPGSRQSPIPSQPRPANLKNGARPRTVVTTQWETFDSIPELGPTSSPPPLIPLSPTMTSARSSQANNNKFSWDLL